jgi:hypothetical protein
LEKPQFLAWTGPLKQIETTLAAQTKTFQFLWLRMSKHCKIVPTVPVFLRLQTELSVGASATAVSKAFGTENIRFSGLQYRGPL